MHTPINPSGFPHEQRAINLIVQRCAAIAPAFYHIWSCFDFTDFQGTINEVDLAICSPAGFFLVEIKDWEGAIRGDQAVWTVRRQGRDTEFPNPRILINQKAKRFASLLRAENIQCFVQDKVFLSHPAVQFSQLPDHIAINVHDRHSLFDALLRPNPPHKPLTLTLLRQLESFFQNFKAPSARKLTPGRTVGTFNLQTLLYESVHRQVWEAQPQDTPTFSSRLELYPWPNGVDRQQHERAVVRAHALLVGLDHAGLDKPQRPFGASETNAPGLVFETYHQRFDTYLRQKRDRLSLREQLLLVRQVLDTLSFAHEHQLYHRGLCPSALIVPDKREPARLKLGHWLTGLRQSSSVHLSPTGEPFDLLDDPDRLYLAPEVDQDQADPAAIDVFGLGALTYTVLSGRPPATNPEERSRLLREQQGLDLNQALDGVSPKLADLVRQATHPRTDHRLTLAEFRQHLDAIDAELRQHRPHTTHLPAQAVPGDVLEGGWLVKQVLGRGACAVVYQVTDPQNQAVALKLALDPDKNALIEAEHRALTRLSLKQIVACRGLVAIGAHQALLLEICNLGDLKEYLAQFAPLETPLVESFGDQLLTALTYLENEGVNHRDLKPENIGLAGTAAIPQLKLLDFSLSDQPPSAQVGTRAYRDPFLGRGVRRHWDRAAELYAAALTLHRIASGFPPRWDPPGAPEVTDGRHLPELEYLDPALRSGLAALFNRAFECDHRQRFQSARDLHLAWLAVFAALPSPSPTATLDPDSPALLSTTTLDQLQLEAATAEALRHHRIATVADLLERDLLGLPGLGRQTRVKLGILQHRLRERFPDHAAPSPPSQGTGLVPREPEAAVPLLEAFFGLAGDDLRAQLSPAHLAQALDRPLAQVEEALDHWYKNKAKKAGPLTKLRHHLAQRLVLQPVQPLHLLAETLELPGSEGRPRERLALARAASYYESRVAGPRWQEIALERGLLLVAADYKAPRPAVSAYVAALADCADALAARRPLPSAQVVAFELAQLPAPTPHFTDPELRLSLAVAFGAVHVNQLGELYPVDFSAAEALRHARGTLVGQERLTLEELNLRVRSRFPLAPQLTEPARLLELLGECDLACRWDGQYFVFRSEHTITVHPPRPRPARDPDGFLAQLAGQLDLGAALMLGVAVDRHAAALQLLRQLDLEALDGDRLVLDQLRQVADQKQVPWSTVLQADAEPADSLQGRNLRQLIVGPARLRLAQQLAALTRPLLLFQLGLFERYDLLDLITQLRLRAGQPGGPQAVLVLLPLAHDRSPRIGTTPLPVFSPSQWQVVPDHW